jgi:hypothetical protein
METVKEHCSAVGRENLRSRLFNSKAKEVGSERYRLHEAGAGH